MALPSGDSSMKLNTNAGASIAALTVLAVLAACSQGAPSAQSVATAIVEVPTAVVATLEPRFNPTSAVGGGANASNAVSTDDLNALLAGLPQATAFKVTANSSPAGARGAEVTSISLNVQDTAGVLKSLDQAGKRTMVETLLNAAGTTWPKATVSLLVTDATAGGSPIIGSRPPGGPNLVLVS
jgi:hypothetical protein